MDEMRAFFSPVNEETARLRWFEAFMRGRVELEQQMISGLQALLEGAPPLPDRKLLWHCALEKLLDGTQDELHDRREELERLKDHVQASGISITDADMFIRDLNLEFEQLESTEGVDSAQAATATLHKDWLDIKSAGSVQRSLSDLFSSGRAQKEKLEKRNLQAHEAFEKYHKQDLTYRRLIHQRRQSQEQLLNLIPDRIQEYGTKYWNAVRDVGMVMESFADYLRNVSSACNSAGSAMWASAKNMKPLVDANSHTEAIESAYHQSPLRFSPIHYRNPGSRPRSPSGQTILFGCPLELYTVGELKKIPPVLEYLLDSVHDWPNYYYHSFLMENCWPLANALEQVWTGVEETDRAIISKLAPQDIDRRFLIMGYFKTLPKPVWTQHDIGVALELDDNPSSPIWDTWFKDPIMIAVLRAMVSWQVRSGRVDFFGWEMADALAQRYVDYFPQEFFKSLSGHPDIWRSPVGNIQEENHEAS